MKLNKLTSAGWQKRSWWLLGLIALAASATVAGIVFVGSSSNQKTSNRQAEVAERGANVMPFDLEKTTHIFQASSDGGVEIILANDPSDNQQIKLVQQHL